MSRRGDDTGPATTLVVDALPGAGVGGPPLPEPPAPNGLACLFAGLRLVLARPRVLLLLMAWAWLLPLAVALPIFSSAQRHVAHAAAAPAEAPADLLGSTPAWLLREWAHAGGGELDAAAQTLAALYLVASLFGLLVAAGWMTSAVAARDHHGLRAFLGGGGRMWFPFLRTWLLGLPLAALWTWLTFGAPGEALMAHFVEDGDPALATSETVARRLQHGRELLYVGGLLLLELWLDLARATLVVGKRASAFAALARGAREGLRRPLGVLSLVGFGSGLELVWIAALKAGTDLAGGGLLALGLLLPLGRVALRGARLAGLARFVAQAEARRSDARARRPAAGPPPDEFAAL